MSGEKAIDEVFVKHYMTLGPLPLASDIFVYQARDLFETWQRYESMTLREAEPPFWAIVWPAAQVMAAHLLAHPELVKGKCVLELGCGSGVVAVAAALAGAKRVIANDIDPDALWLAQVHGRVNRVKIEFEDQDRLEDLDLGPAQVLLLADGFYSRGFAERTIEFFEKAKGAGLDILVADADRPFAPSVDLLEVLDRQTVYVEAEVEGASERQVTLSRYRG